ncbi:hypothetical protein N2152v2_004748 [Parachlorella kessleri]
MRITCLSALNLLVQLLTMGCGVGIFLIVRQELWVQGDWAWSDFFNNFKSSGANVCLMAKPSLGSNVCAYSYVAVAVGWVVAILVLLVQVFKDSWRCACFEYLVGFFAVVWWAVAAIVATVYGVQANKADVPKQNYRAYTILLAFAQLGLALITVALTCCGGCEPLEDLKDRIAAIHSVRKSKNSGADLSPLRSPHSIRSAPREVNLV